MSADESYLGLPTLKINIKLDINRLVEAVGQWLNGRHKRDIDRRSETLSALHLAQTIVTKLEAVFIERIQDFQNTKIVNSPAKLREAVEKTKQYLAARELLPQLNELRGYIQEQSAMQEFAKQEHVLTEAWHALDAFRHTLGMKGPTGVMWSHLLQAIERAEDILDSRRSSEELISFAKYVYNEHEREPAENVEVAIGAATAQLAGTR